MVWYAEQYNQKPTGGNSGVMLLCIPTLVGFFIGDAMKKIPLTQGKFALVDDEAFEELSRYKWYAAQLRYGGFMAVRDRKPTIYMHRVIMVASDKFEVDHVNHNTLDNRRSNLRLATSTQNHHNQKKAKGCSSKYKGVSFNKRSGRWEVYITINNKQRHLGCFDIEIEAASLYDEAAKKHFGKFAKLNLTQTN